MVSYSSCVSESGASATKGTTDGFNIQVDWIVSFKIVMICLVVTLVTLETKDACMVVLASYK